MPATISRSNLLLLVFCCSASVTSAANYKIESTTIGSLNCQKLTNIKTGNHSYGHLAITLFLAVQENVP